MKSTPKIKKSHHLNSFFKLFTLVLNNMLLAQKKTKSLTVKFGLQSSSSPMIISDL